MNKADILIVGAGAAGLMAAHVLAKMGKKVTVLEARDRCGGRIYTLYDKSRSVNKELGAEFVHGDLPVTLNLLNEAGISYHHASGEMFHHKNGRFDSDGGFMFDWGMLMDKLGRLENDTSIEDFLQHEFPGDKYNELKYSVRRFVHGYDTADTGRASAFALRNEWESDDEGSQYRIDGGYGAMMDYLEKEFKREGGIIYLNSAVKDIHWQRGIVKAITTGGRVYEAAQILIALPLGVLQATEDTSGSVVFHPSIPQQLAALNLMGFGAVIKILLEFKELFWEDRAATLIAGKSLRDMSFLLSEQEIPTWWTQSPNHIPVLTGWLGGPAAERKRGQPTDVLLQQSLQSLSIIFKRPLDELREMLVDFQIVNWTDEPFTRGSYTYDTIESAYAKEILSSPVEDTLFFAGEYLYEGPAMGTVEAALTSGSEAAKRMLGN